MLPAVFVDKTAGKALDERGLVLVGGEFRKKYMTNVMRSLGRAVNGGGFSASADVFTAVGTALVARRKEVPEEVIAHAVEEEEREVDSQDNANFKWKVTSNTAYLWSSQKITVNYGAKAPPSAQKMVRVNVHGQEVHQVDASADITPESEMDRRARRTVVASTLVEVEDFRSQRLAAELQEVLVESDDMPNDQNLPQLSEESDFKIEYKIEEVEVAVGEKMSPVDAEAEESQMLEEEGAVIAHLGVPPGRFWIVATFLIVSTTVLGLLLAWQMMPREKKAEDPEEDEMPPPFALMLHTAAKAGYHAGSAFMERRASGTP